MQTKQRLEAFLTVLDRHLQRVESLVPARPEQLVPMTEASDGVVLHLWQAVQITLDTALRECAARGLATPPDYAGAFRTLRDSGVIETELCTRLVQAVGFRNAVAHGYEKLDMPRVWQAAKTGPADLRAFFAAVLVAAQPGAS